MGGEVREEVGGGGGSPAAMRRRPASERGGGPAQMDSGGCIGFAGGSLHRPLGAGGVSGELHAFFAHLADATADDNAAS